MATAQYALANMPQEKLARLALKARNRLRNQAVNQQRFKARMMAVGSSLLGASVAGYLMGGAMADRDSNQAAIETGAMEDPTKFGGVDKDLAVGFVLTVVGIAVQSFSKNETLSIAGEVIEGSGVGAFAYWMGSRTQEWGFERKQLAAQQMGSLA